MNKKDKIQEAEILLEKYYEGMTTVPEEKWLQEFLSQDNLPVRFDADKAMLGFFASQKETHKNHKYARIVPFVRWASVAAALIVAVFTTEFLLTANGSDYVYIDGKRYTDVRIIKDKALSSIKDIDVRDEVKESASLLENNEDLIVEQLSVFTDIE